MKNVLVSMIAENMHNFKGIDAQIIATLSAKVKW